MSAKSAEGTLLYPKHLIKPEDFLHFVELDEFVRCWSDLEMDVDHELWALQIAIMSNPTGFDVIPGTGGLRKMRYATGANKGKRSGIRVCYAFFPEAVTVLLVAAYAKNEKIDLSAKEKEGIKQYLDRIGDYLNNRKVS